jgi:hypothetical protein
MENVKRVLRCISVLTIVAAIGGLVMVFFILPSMNWSATRKPGQVENTIASYITSNWIRRNAAEESNPFHPTPENLKQDRPTSMGTAPAVMDLPATAKIGLRPTSILQSRSSPATPKNGRTASCIS